MLKSNMYIVLSVVIISLGAFLRFSWLTHQSLWYDEGISLVISDGTNVHDVFRVMWGRPGGDKYQPLYYTLLFAWRQWFGSSEFLLRTLSVLPGIGAIGLVYLTAKQLYGHQHGCWSALLLAASAFCIYLSQEVRPFSLQLFLAALQLYCLVGVFAPSKRPRWQLALVFGLVTALNFWGGILLVVFSLALAIAHFVAQPQIKQWLLWWWPAALLSLPGVVYYALSPAAADPSGDSTNGLGMPLYKSAAYVLHGLLVGSSYGPPLDFLRSNPSLGRLIGSYGWSLAAVLAVAVVLTVGVGTYYWRQVNRGALRPADTFLAWLLVIAFGLSAVLAGLAGINWMPRHSFFVYLPLCLVLPLGLNVDLGRVNSTQWGATLLKVALVALVALNLVATRNYFFNADYWRDDYRSAARYLVDHRQPGEASVLLWGTPRLLDYYGDGQTVSALGVAPQTLPQTIEQLTAQAPVVYVSVNREFTWARQQNLGPKGLVGVLGPFYTLAGQVEFTNFNIYRFHHHLSAIEGSADLGIAGAAHGGRAGL